METEARILPASAAGAVSVLNPWRSIWFSPRQTVRALINADDPPSWVPAFLVFLIGSWLERVNLLWAQGHLRLPLAVVRATVLRFALHCAVFWATAWFLGVYGRRQRGVGTAKNLRLALGWSCAPFLPYLLAWGPIWILSGGPLYAEADVQSIGWAVAWLLYLLVSIAWVWMPILMVVTVAEVHRFPVWQSIESLVCTIFAVLIGPLLALALIAKLFL